VNRIEIHVLFFGELRDRAGVDRDALSVPFGVNVAGVIDATAEQYPALRMLLRKAKFAVNNNAASRLSPLQDGDELAFFPAPANA
jgi:molybdopterin converting factor small subunit